MQFGEHDLRRRNSFLSVNIDRNAAAVIDHSHRIVDVDGDFDFGAIARQRFVDGIIDYFVDQVVQTRFTRRTDVHGRPFSDCFKAFQHLD